MSKEKKNKIGLHRFLTDENKEIQFAEIAERKKNIGFKRLILSSLYYKFVKMIDLKSDLSF